MGNNPSVTKGELLPVTNVFWNDCQDFIKKLNAKTNGGYRLPTEAEWEYACRAGTTTAYFFGDAITTKHANSRERGAGQVIKLTTVGCYKPNAFGIYDMHGSVWEWCEDKFGNYPAEALTDPKGPATGDGYIMRGGSFVFNVSMARSSNRVILPPTRLHVIGFGFRLVRTAENKTDDLLKVIKPNPVAVIPAVGNLLVAPFTEAKAKEVQKLVAKSLQKEVEEKEDLGKGIKLEMVLIPAGRFMMGSPVSEVGRVDNETQHEVTLTKPYYMGKYEVTQEQWEVVMGNNPSSRTKGARLPVTDISWNDCQEFIKKLNAKTKGGYRLPTEAEWEYACRAGTITAYSFGDAITPKDANCIDPKIGIPAAVGNYQPNVFGLFDMHGNVWEWCEDWFGGYLAGVLMDPKGPATGGTRVLRGGSFKDNISLVRSSMRGLNGPPAIRVSNYGFRLAKTP